MEKAEEKKKKAEEKKREKAERKKLGNKPNKGEIILPPKCLAQRFMITIFLIFFDQVSLVYLDSGTKVALLLLIWGLFSMDYVLFKGG